MYTSFRPPGIFQVFFLNGPQLFGAVPHRPYHCRTHQNRENWENQRVFTPMSRGVEFLLCNSEVVCIPLFRSRRRAATRYASNYNIVCRTLLHLTKTITSSYLTSSWVSGTGPATQTRSGCYQQPDCVVPYLKQTSPNNTVKH